MFYFVKPQTDAESDIFNISAEYADRTQNHAELFSAIICVKSASVCGNQQVSSA